MRPLTIALILALVGLTGCGVSVDTGGSSGPSEEQVAELLHDHNVYAPECVKSTNGSSRDFDCTGESRNSSATLRLEVTVAESGDTVVITHCEGRVEACDEIYGEGYGEGGFGGGP